MSIAPPSREITVTRKQPRNRRLLLIISGSLLIAVSIITISIISISHSIFSGLEREIENVKHPNNGTSDVAPLLLVVIAVNMTQLRLAEESQRAYCQRHGYRMVVQKQWRGKVRPKRRYAVRAQKLIACSLSQGEKFMLILDADIVIAPWTPPIHLEPVGEKIGVVDEDQPTARFNAAVQMKKFKRVIDENRYYTSPFGRVIQVSHGLLNTGMLLIQPKLHCRWLEDVYYHPSSQRWFSDIHSNYDQPVLGAAMIRNQNYYRMHHAWNRGWIWYKEAVRVGGLRYSLGQVFRQSYFIHFYLDKERINDLAKWMKKKNLTFKPQPYATKVLP